MTALLAIVRSVQEAIAAFGAGADQVAIAAGDRPIGRPRLRRASAGPMLTEQCAEPVRSIQDAVAAGFDRVWLPLSPVFKTAIQDAIARDLAVVATVPLGRRLEPGICDEAAAYGVQQLLLMDLPFGPTRALDVIGMTALAEFEAVCRSRGIAVGVAGGIEPPDIPRLLALDPAVVGLDRVPRDDRDRFAPDRLRAVRALWTEAASVRSPTHAKQLDRIFVRDWIVTMSVGAYARERQALQRVRFGVEAEIVPAEPFAAGMAGVVSYDLIIDAIDRLASGHVDLVETLAEDLAATVLGHPRVASVAVTVEKLDLGPGSVGCHIARRRPG